jgi:hypothetical protein
MPRPVRQLLLLNTPNHDVELPPEAREEIVEAMASLLLQTLEAEVASVHQGDEGGVAHDGPACPLDPLANARAHQRPRTRAGPRPASSTTDIDPCSRVRLEGLSRAATPAEVNAPSGSSAMTLEPCARIPPEDVTSTDLNRFSAMSPQALERDRRVALGYASFSDDSAPHANAPMATECDPGMEPELTSGNAFAAEDSALEEHTSRGAVVEPRTPASPLRGRR